MERIQEILTTIDNWLWGNWLLFVLLAVGVGRFYDRLIVCQKEKISWVCTRLSLALPSSYVERRPKSYSMPHCR